MDRQQQQGNGQPNRQSQQQAPDRANDSQQRQQGNGQQRQYGGSQQGGMRRPGARQQSQEGAGAQSFGTQQIQSMAEVALRGTALLFDLQMETARNIMRTQARTAALLGAPDYSELFRLGDDRARRHFAASTEQVLNSARQARETVFEVQRQIGRLAEQQTIGIAEEMREQIEQMTRRTEEGLQEIKQVASAEADHAENIADYATQGDERQRAEGEQRPSDRLADATGAQSGAHGESAQQNGHRPNEEAHNAGAEANVESNLAHVNEPSSRDRERGRARR